MKKVMTAVLAAAMCLSMTVVAMADGIQPRAPICDECGRTTSRTIISREYLYMEDVECNKYPDKTDNIPYYEVTAEYTCSTHGGMGEFTYVEAGSRICRH